MSELHLPDALPRSWLQRLLPATALPYVQLARIDRPVGWWLLVLPCWWSSALAADALGQIPNFFQLLMLLIGAVAMRGAGCTYNDIADADLDAQVTRTRMRPIPSGRVSRKQAAVFLIFQCLVGLGVVLTLNAFAIKLAFLSLLIVAIYPFMKRITSWPQAVLGLAFAWGGLEGWAAFTGTLAPAPFFLFAAAIFWTMGYDTIYAVQDIADDSIIGIKSTARFFGDNVVSGVAGLYLASVVLAMVALLLAPAGILAWAGLSAFALHLSWQLRAIEADNPARALQLFRSNRDAGLLFFAGIGLDSLVHGFSV